MPLPVRLRWKIERYRRSIEERFGGLRGLLKDSMTKQKVCPACRALIGARETRCPFCNERLGAVDRVGVRRLVKAIFPEGPRTTTILLAANFLMFGFSLLAAMRAGIGIEAMFGRMPVTTLVALGARDYHVLEGEWWRLVTAAFLHGNIVHLLFNCWVLFDVGPAVEEMYGTTKFVVLYFFAAITGSLGSLYWHPLVVMVGASGALFGLIGVMIAYGYRHRTTLAEQMKAMYVRWAIYGLVFGFIMGADNAAHIGGLAGGIAFGLIVNDTPSFTRSSIVAWRVASYAAVVAIGVSFLMVALNYRRFA